MTFRLNPSRFSRFIGAAAATLVLQTWCLDAAARVELPRMFGNGMVVQRNAQVNLWGTARANATVKIIPSWSRQTVRTTADANGRWRAVLSTPDADGATEHTIVLDDGERTELRNILLGEVWICSGQSNMEMPLKGFKGQPVEGATEDLIGCTDRCLRLFTVKRNSQLHPVDTVSGSWREATPASVRNFSATAYYFGRALRRALDVPVGLVVAAWGGSSCEAWMTAEWLRPFADTRIPLRQEDIWSPNRCATVLYNGMLHPLVGMAMRGVIWYQGEDNVPRHPSYAAMLESMIGGWRAAWAQGPFPFYYCQIAPYDYSLINWGGLSPFLREQQTLVERRVENCRMACLMDAGLRYGIHPRKKRQAGERLALLALANTYGVKGLPEFAAFSSVEFRGDTAVVAFDRSKEWIYFEQGQPTPGLYKVAGEDRQFHDADARIERNRLYLHSPRVAHPVAVRYAFDDWAQGDLMHDGLPVSSFRTDTWDAPQGPTTTSSLHNH